MATRQENQRQYQKTHYDKNKSYYANKRETRRLLLLAKFNEFKATLTCALCPENCPVALDFHHKDPTNKDKEVFQLVNNGRSWNKILAEIEKCYCLCSNCHRKVHRLDGWATKLVGLPTLKVFSNM